MALECLATLIVRGRISGTGSSIEKYRGGRDLPERRGMRLPGASDTLTESCFANVAPALRDSCHEVTLLLLGHPKPDATRVPRGSVRFGHSGRFAMSPWFLHAFQTYPTNMLGSLLCVLLISCCQPEVFLCRAWMVLST